VHRALGDWKAALRALEDGLISCPGDPLILRDATRIKQLTKERLGDEQQVVE
jgi:hypothetical protein